MVLFEGEVIDADPQPSRSLGRYLLWNPVDVGDANLVRTLGDLCHAVHEEVGLSGVALSLLTGTDSAVVVAATDVVARARAGLPFDVGEGPGREAWRTNRPVLVPDLTAVGVHPWPGYLVMALQSGLAAVFALPLSVGAVRLGVLEIHNSTAHALANDALRRALSFARMATAVLLDAQVREFSELASPASEVFDQHAEIYQAQGMLTVLLDINAGEALARMRAHAFVNGQSLLGLARQIVSGRVFTEGEI